MRYSSVRIRVIIFDDEDSEQRVLKAQSHNKVDNPRQAPSIDHLGVRVHVDAFVDGRAWEREGQRSVLGQSSPVLLYTSDAADADESAALMCPMCIAV